MLKTEQIDRMIPLVGFTLEVFQQYPEGFTRYYDKSESLSAMLGKYLRERKLLPTTDHAVYSLRRSFQDRILAVNAPDRVQAELMGHRFNRQEYGLGASLQQKLEWLQKIQLKR